MSNTLPATACYLSAIVEVSTNGENAKTAPVKLIARTTKPVNSHVPEIGMIVHDFAGMRLSKNRMPIDYGHDDATVIGYANNIEIAGDELHMSGALVPYGENDKASEVIYKSQNGIPYEASITTGSEIVVEKLAKGKTATVNGVEITGPVTIFREWELRGVAITPYGRDSNTSAHLALNDNQGVVTMSEVQVTAEPEVKPVEGEADKDTSPTEAKAVEVEQVVEVAEVATVEATTEMSEGVKFLTHFGEQGGVWFAQGLSFTDAQTKFYDKLKEENASLKTELEKAKTELSSIRGESKAVSFSPMQTDEQKVVAEKLTQFKGKLPDGLAKFAATLDIKK